MIGQGRETRQEAGMGYRLRFARSHMALVMAGLIFLVGCANSENNLFGMGQNETIGTAGGAAVGAAAGGLISKNAVGAAIGAVLGGAIGNRIGAYLDDREKQRLTVATERAAEHAQVGQKVAWSNPGQSGQPPTATGWVTPNSEPFQNANGQTCRNVTQTVKKNGETAQDDVTVCKTVSANGKTSWAVPQG
jgi:surface antigen